MNIIEIHEKLLNEGIDYSKLDKKLQYEICKQLTNVYFENEIEKNDEFEIVYPNKFHLITDIKEAEGKEGLFYINDGIDDKQYDGKLRPILEKWIGDVLFEKFAIPAGIETMCDFSKNIEKHVINYNSLNKLSLSKIDYYYEKDINSIRFFYPNSLCLWGNKVKLNSENYRTTEIAIIMTVAKMIVNKKSKDEIVECLEKFICRRFIYNDYELIFENNYISLSFEPTKFYSDIKISMDNCGWERLYSEYCSLFIK